MCSSNLSMKEEDWAFLNELTHFHTNYGCFNVIKFLNKCAKEIKIYITYQTEAGKG